MRFEKYRFVWLRENSKIELRFEGSNEVVKREGFVGVV